MEIRHLEYFIEVSRHKSFSKAAEVTHISQPTISKAIKDLEAELGKTLFYRSTKYVELTDAGKAILEQAQQIVASFRNIHVQLEGLEKQEIGKVHIGLPHITAVTTFSHILGSFKKHYPRIEIQLYEYGPKKIEASLQEGLLDFGIFTPEDGDLFEWIWFERDPHSVVMNPTHWLTCHNTIDYENLQGEQLIIYNSDYKLHDIILDRCKKSGFIPQVAFETSQRELMIQMVTAGLGVALLPSKICHDLDPEIVTSRPLTDSQLCLELALTWKRGRYLSYASLRFLNSFKMILTENNNIP